MFTGLVESLGQIKSLQLSAEGDMIVAVSAPELGLKNAELGDSIAVNGVCLTAVSLEADSFVADVSKETIEHTRFTELKVGDKVNLEKALTLSRPLGGHLVSGHVDGLGQVKDVSKDARSVRITIEAPQELAKYIATKGSICVDGVSLTVNKVEGSVFSLNIVPHTAERTIINGYHPGTRVHLEVDIIARYLERLLQGETADDQPESRVTKTLLAKHGFLK